MTSAEYEEYERFLAEPFPEQNDEYIPVGRIAERDLWKDLEYDK